MVVIRPKYYLLSSAPSVDVHGCALQVIERLIQNVGLVATVQDVDFTLWNLIIVLTITALSSQSLNTQFYNQLNYK